MAQISKGDTFTNGEQVTAARLNQLVDSSTLLAGAILDQGAMTANTVAATDSVLLYDLSATALRKPTVSDVLNSNLPVTTSAITGGAGVNVVITPAATYKVDVAGAFEADSSTIVGAATVGGTLGVTGAVTASSTLGVTGALTASSTLAVTGTTTLTGAATAGDVTASGTVNITGAIQYNGTPVFGMYEVVRYNANPTVALTKPADEIWVINGFAVTSGQNNVNTISPPSLIIQATTTINGFSQDVIVGSYESTATGVGENAVVVNQPHRYYTVFVIPSATTFTSKTLAGNWQVITITKYKTA